MCRRKQVRSLPRSVISSHKHSIPPTGIATLAASINVLLSVHQRQRGSVLVLSQVPSSLPSFSSSSVSLLSSGSVVVNVLSPQLPVVKSSVMSLLAQKTSSVVPIQTRSPQLPCKSPIPITRSMLPNQLPPSTSTLDHRKALPSVLQAMAAVCAHPYNPIPSRTVTPSRRRRQGPNPMSSPSNSLARVLQDRTRALQMLQRELRLCVLRAILVSISIQTTTMLSPKYPLLHTNSPLFLDSPATIETRS